MISSYHDRTIDLLFAFPTHGVLLSEAWKEEKHITLIVIGSWEHHRLNAWSIGSFNSENNQLKVIVFFLMNDSCSNMEEGTFSFHVSFSWFFQVRWKALCKTFQILPGSNRNNYLHVLLPWSLLRCPSISEVLVEICCLLTTSMKHVKADHFVMAAANVCTNTCYSSIVRPSSLVEHLGIGSVLLILRLKRSYLGLMENSISLEPGIIATHFTLEWT